MDQKDNRGIIIVIFVLALLSIEIFSMNYLPMTSNILILLTFGETGFFVILALVLVVLSKMNYKSVANNSSNNFKNFKVNLCTKCGQKSKVHDIYCQNCGYKLSVRN